MKTFLKWIEEQATVSAPTPAPSGGSASPTPTPTPSSNNSDGSKDCNHNDAGTTTKNIASYPYRLFGPWHMEKKKKKKKKRNK